MALKKSPTNQVITVSKLVKDLTLPIRPGDQAEQGQVYANGEMLDIEMHPDVFNFRICQENG